MSVSLMKRTPALKTAVVLVVALAVAGLLAAAPLARPALAVATFTVDRNDDPDPTTANACTDAAADDCSMRGAVVAANAAAGADEITLPAGTFTLTIAGAGEDAASTGDLDVTDDLTITGAGAGETSVAGGAAPFDDRIFEYRPGFLDDQPDVTATITGLTITGGKAGGGGGGGIATRTAV